MIENTLGKLVEYPSITEDRDANNEMLDDVGMFLMERGMHVGMLVNEVEGVSRGVKSLVATTHPKVLDPTVMIASHLDVVPAVSPTAFKPDVVGDKFYGRGTLDMKFNVAATMEIIDELYREGTLSQYDLAILLTTDEETGGYLGTEWVLEKYGLRPKVCILPDGGDDWQIQTSSKGFMHYKVATTGISGHSRAPWAADNAIERLGTIMSSVRGLFPVEMGPDTNTNSINMVHGGLAANQVPESAEFVSDARFVSPEEMARVRAEIGSICMDHAAELSVLTEGDPAKFDLENPYIAPFRRLVAEVTGIEVVGSKTLGSSDARFFSKYGIPVVSLYPTGGGHHSEGEWISVTALHQYKDVLRMYLDQMAKVPLLTKEAAAERTVEPA